MYSFQPYFVLFWGNITHINDTFLFVCSTQVVDELDYDVLGAGSNPPNNNEPLLPTPNLSRRPSDTPSICSNRNLKTRANTRRVSLITGEALEQAHAALALAQLSGEQPPTIPSAIVAATLRAQESQLSLTDCNSRRPSVSLYHPPPDDMDFRGDDDGGGRGGDDEKADDRRARRKNTMREESVGTMDGSVPSPQR